MLKNLFNKDYPYAIRYWPTWFIVFIFWCLTHLPYTFQLTLGKYLGLIAYKIAKREKRITHLNLSRCFPQLSETERENLSRESFISMGMGTFETTFGWWASKKRLENLVQIEGLENVKDALKKGKGALIFTPHFSSLHIVGSLATLFHPFAAMFFPPKYPVFREISRRHMNRIYLKAIPRDDVRSLIKMLKKNTAMLYTPDTDAGPKSSVFASFFGVQTATVTASARFPQVTGCAILPVNYFRRKDNRGYIIRFYPALENYPTNDASADARTINEWLEKFILEHPEQYLWQYKRFKTRPPGEAKFY